MGYKELIEALREEGERKIKEILKEADEKVITIMKERESRIEELRKEYEERFNAEVKGRRDLILREAKREATRIRLKAEEELSRRLYRKALTLLENLRKEGYNEIFKALVKEIPDSKWITVIVNPEDLALAKSFYPYSEVIGDPSITGGFVVINSDGNVITNTFEKRLEMLWPGILPEIMKAIGSIDAPPDR